MCGAAYPRVIVVYFTFAVPDPHNSLSCDVFGFSFLVPTTATALFSLLSFGCVFCSFDFCLFCSTCILFSFCDGQINNNNTHYTQSVGEKQEFEKIVTYLFLNDDLASLDGKIIICP